MTATCTVVVLFVATVTGLVLGQVVEIASDLDAAGRSFSCTGEVVTYTCSAQGTILFVQFPPLINQQAFISRDPIPDVQIFPTAPNVILTLTSGMPNFTANLQIRVTSDLQQMDFSCSTDISGPLNDFVLPLIHEVQIEPPSTVTFSGDTTVSWTPPLNPQFDMDYYIVRIYMDGVLYTTRSSRDNGLDVTLPSGEITADVRTVSTCGSISAAQQSVGSISGGCANGSVSVTAGFLVPIVLITSSLLSYITGY